MFKIEDEIAAAARASSLHMTRHTRTHVHAHTQEEIEAAVFKIEDEMAAAARTSSSSHQPNSTAAAKGWGGAAHSQRSFSPGPGEK